MMVPETVTTFTLVLMSPTTVSMMVEPLRVTREMKVLWATVGSREGRTKVVEGSSVASTVAVEKRVLVVLATLSEPV